MSYSKETYSEVSISCTIYSKTVVVIVGNNDTQVFLLCYDTTKEESSLRVSHSKEMFIFQTTPNGTVEYRCHVLANLNSANIQWLDKLSCGMMDVNY